MVRVELTDEDIELATRVAEARMTETTRQTSAHFMPARNLLSQTRGAAGEIAAAKWLRSQGLHVVDHFRDDHVTDCDIQVAGIGIEVMTAQVDHRKVTGFCVPPGKLRAARRRQGWGYLFVGTGAETRPRLLTIQAAVRMADVDNEPARETRVGGAARDNFVIREEDLLTPAELIEELQGKDPL